MEKTAAMHHLEQRGISTVIHVDHDLDLASSPMLEATIRLAEIERERPIIVSLERCSFCDAAGLTVLVRARQRNGSRFAVVVPDRARCYRIFQITGLAWSLSIYPSLQLALGARPSDGPLSAC